MFSKTITNSSRFLMMPPTAQLLYIHFGMNADDDGFCEHFPIMRMVEAKPDDLKILAAKGFVQVFDDQVLVITEWRENNYIQNDRYTPSKYLQIYKAELEMIPKAAKSEPRIQNVYKVDTQVRLGKDSLGKDTKTTDPEPVASKDAPMIVDVIEAFAPVNSAYKKWFARRPQRDAASRLIECYGLEQVKKVIKLLPVSNTMQYFPTITTPLELEDRWAKLEAAWQRKRNEADSKKTKVAF